MRTNHPWDLDSLEPGTREAARHAANRAGMSMEDWVAQAVAAGPGFAQRRAVARPAKDGRESVRPRSTEPAAAASPASKLDDMLAALSAENERRSGEHASRTAVALNSVARWIERTEERLIETSRRAVEGQERTTAVLGDALGLMGKRLDRIERIEDRLGETSRLVIEGQERAASLFGESLARLTQRLDEIESKIADGSKPSVAAALEAVARIEAQVARLDAERPSGVAPQVEAALRGFEDRIGQIVERLASARPIGRRGVPATEEVRDAVGEIRSRQAELDEAPAGQEAGAPPRSARLQDEMLASLRREITRLAGQLDGLRPPVEVQDQAALIQSELARMQDAIGGLATRQEVAALERSLRSLGDRIAQAQAPTEAAALQATLDGLHAEIRRLSQAEADGGAGRIGQDVDALARRIDFVASSGIDPSVAEGLSKQLGDLRRVLSDIADPRGVERLQAELATLNDRVAEIAARQVDSSAFERLKTAVEGIRAQEFGARIDSLGDRIDRLGRAPEAGVMTELRRLSSKVDGALVATGDPRGIEPLLDRLDQIEGRLLQPAPGAELKSIEEMLRSLAAKLDAVDRPGADLDALERQVESIAIRLDRSGGADPKLASLERAMADLMTQVGTMREDALEAAERATRSAIADTLKQLPAETGAEDLGGLRRDLAELKAHYSAADKRTHATLETLHTALERLVARLETLEKDLGRERPDPARAAPVRDRIAEAMAAQARGEHASRGGRSTAEVLLEPGAARPQIDSARAEAQPAEMARLDALTSGRSESGSPAEGEGADIKANFIAAARRAAQAAAAEVSSAKGSAREGGKGRLGRFTEPARAPDATGERVGLAARMRRNIDRRRRPILIGLAGVVLALGALQVAGQLGGSAPPTVAAAPEPRRPEPQPAAAAQPASAPQKADPVTTQSIATEASRPVADAARGETNAAAAASAAPSAPPRPAPVERVAGIDPSDVPANVGPGVLRQAALAGDPAAVYELASRFAEGRGVARDAKLAAKLFEKAAASGVAPAQYRIGNLYEKGLGVQRDLAQAKVWYQRAAEKGNARAMHNLAVLLAEGAGGRPDYAAAVEWFRKAAEHGVRDSQFNLAVLLARGLGTGQDLSGSYQWFALAAAQGDDDAAKKRDEIAGRLSAADLAAVKKVAERWRPKTLDQGANEVGLPPSEWTEAPRRPAPNGRV